MALTEEQFDNLRKKGLSVQQITEFEKGGKPDERGVVKKGVDFLTKSEQAFGQTLGDVGALFSKDVKSAQNIPVQEAERQGKLAEMIVQNKKAGKDTTRLEQVFKNLSGSDFNMADIIPSLNKSNKQIFGEGFGVATDILGAGSLAGKGAGVTKGATGIGAGIKQGLKTGVKEGAIFGVAEGVFRAMQDDAEVMDIVKGGVTGALFGGGGGAAVGGLLGGAGGALTSRAIRRLDLEKAVKKGELAGVKFKIKDIGGKQPVGVTIKDKIAINAIDAGIEPRQVNLIKSGSGEDRKIFREMVKVAERASDDLTIVDRPIDITGKSIVKRVKFLLDKKKIVGKQLDKTIRDLPKTPIELNQVYNDFVEDLTSGGIRVRSNQTLDFRNSIYKNDTKAQKLLQDIHNDIRPNKNGNVLRTPERIVGVRRRIFNELDLGKKKNELSDNLSRVAENYRKNLLKVLTDLSGDFGKVNQDNAKISSSLSKFNKLMGRDFDITDEAAKIRAGEVSRRLMGNAKFKPFTIMKELDDNAVEFGFKGADDILKQAQFAQLLEDLYDLAPQTGLQGQVMRGVENAVEGIGLAEDVANRNLGSLLAKGFKKIKGITPERQKAIIKKMISDITK